MSRASLIIVLNACVMLGGLSGCTVSTSKDSKTGQDKNVDIHTPFGSLSVHKGASDIKETGASAYPGAQIKNDLNDDDHDSANVNISSSFFGLKVVSLKYQSNDAPDKILNFYRKDMNKYGKVLDCAGGLRMVFHHQEQDSPVTCGDAVSDHSRHSYGEELKVGTENNQRIIAVRPSGSGSEFALVYVRAWDNKSTM